MILQTLRKSFSVEGWKNLLNFYDENGDFSWQEVAATAVQIAFIVVLYLLSSWMGYDLQTLLGWLQ